jgi:hypothetical protein
LVGALLRREGLHSSYLTAWRRERDQGQLAGLTPKQRGRKPQRSPEADELARLQREERAATTGAGQGEHGHRGAAAGGRGLAARNAFAALSSTDQSLLIKFVNSI